MHTLPDDKYIVLKGPVRFSQTINNTYTVQITLQRKNSKVVDVTLVTVVNRGLFIPVDATKPIGGNGATLPSNSSVMAPAYFR